MQKTEGKADMQRTLSLSQRKTGTQGMVRMQGKKDTENKTGT